MRFAACALSILLWSLAQAGDSATPKTTSDVEGLHAAWFTAFDGGDGAALDKIETENLVLVLPDGSVFRKTEPRAAKMKKHAPATTRALSDVVVREFGDTAILTGLLTSKTGSETTREGTTVVFVKAAGKWKIASAQWTTKTG